MITNQSSITSLQTKTSHVANDDFLSNLILMTLISYVGLFFCLITIVLFALNEGFPVVW